MKLFVRSQNREFMEELTGAYYVWEDNTSHCILGSKKLLLGKYDTREQALKVLDEMEKFIGHDTEMLVITNDNRPFIVYRMPENVPANKEN